MNIHSVTIANPNEPFQPVKDLFTIVAYPIVMSTPAQVSVAERMVHLHLDESATPPQGALVGGVPGLPDPRAAAAGGPVLGTVVHTGEASTGSRKRKRKNDDDVAGVTLPRDDLLSMTSEDFEEYIRKIKDARTLSSTEQTEIKRQRRLIKNRESAQSSRNKKRQFITTLKGQLQQLQEENLELKGKVKALDHRVKHVENVNQQLQGENERLSGGWHKSRGEHGGVPPSQKSS